jgi:hypothetical protein
MKPKAFALLLFVFSLAFYVYTMQPGLAWGDGIRLQREALTAESFILAEMVDVTFAPDPYPFARLGVAAWDHPLYVMLGYGLTRALPGLDALWLVNLISAVFGAGSVALLFWLCYRPTRSLAGAGFAALALAVSHTFWWHAATPEVYTLFTFLLLLTLLAYTAYEENGRFPYLVAAAFTFGLGGANHLLAFLAGLALLLTLALNRALPPGFPFSLRRWAALLLAFVLGFAPFWIQFLRLLRTFPLSEVMGPVVGATFLQGSLALTPGPLLQSALSYLIFLLYQFNPLGVTLGVYGWIHGRRAFPVLWRKTVALYAVYVLFGLVYRVSDQFAFFMGAHLFWAVALGMGAAGLLRARPDARRRALAAGLALLVLAMPPLYAAAPGLLRAAGVDEAAFGVPQIGTGVRDGLAYYLDPNKRNDHGAEAFGRSVMENLPSDALVLAEWYVDTDEYFVLRYFSVVEGLRPDVEIVGWPLEDPFRFDPALAHAAIAAALPARPVYLASLSAQFYAAPDLLARYCIAPEFKLYRVYPRAEGEQRPCLPPDTPYLTP